MYKKASNLKVFISNTSGEVPADSLLEYDQLYINTADQSLLSVVLDETTRNLKTKSLFETKLSQRYCVVLSATLNGDDEMVPAVTVMANTIGRIEVVRAGTGVIELRSNALFVEDKTAPIEDTYYDDDSNKYFLAWISASIIRITISSPTEGEYAAADIAFSNRTLFIEKFV